MTTSTDDFTMFAGDSKLLQVTVKDADDAPVDISGSSIEWAAAALIEGGFNTTPAISKSNGTSGGISVTDGINGVFEVTIDPADTEELAAGKYYHEAQITDLAGDVATVLTGRLTIRPSLIPG